MEESGIAGGIAGGDGKGAAEGGEGGCSGRGVTGGEEGGFGGDGGCGGPLGGRSVHVRPSPQAVLAMAAGSGHAKRLVSAGTPVAEPECCWALSREHNEGLEATSSVGTVPLKRLS